MLDGHLNKCKLCTKLYVNNYRLLFIEEIRAYDRKRSKLTHRKKLKKECNSEYRKKFPEKRKAQAFINNGLRSGKVKRPKHCEKCDRVKIHAHHDDYSKPLDVKWLCPIHHAERHKDLRK